MKEHRCTSGQTPAWVSLTFLIALLATAAPAAAQDAEQTYTLRGTVVDAVTEAPLPGSNVQLEGTTFGTAAGVDGTFSFTARLEPGDYTLVTSFVGYQRAERAVTLGADETVSVGTVPVEEDVLRSEEIIVTGTGVPTERRQLGNAVSSVDARDLETSAPTAIDQALAGKIAGAVISQNSGNPAGGVSVRLRGASTVLGSAQPLYIVDGVIVNNDSPELIDLGGGSQNRLVDLNPNDIERIEVVKGAAAAALYGSRAANGVVQIFTKRGTSGQPRVTFNTSVRTEAVRETIGVNRAQNAEGEFLSNCGTPYRVNPFSCAPLLDEQGNRQPVERLDWQDYVFQRAYGTEQYLSVAGGSPATRYFLSGSHFASQGIVEGNLFRRFNGRVRLNQTLTDWLSVGAGANYTRSHSDDVPNGGLSAAYGSLTGFIFGPNTYDPRPNEFGEYPDPPGTLRANPVEVIDRFDFGQTTNRFIGDVQVDAQPRDGLSVNFVAGLDTYEQVALAFIPIGTTAPGQGGGFARRATRSVLQSNADLNVRYERTLADGVESKTLLGGTYQYEDTQTFSGNAEGLPPITEVASSNAEESVFGEFRSDLTVVGTFAQQTFGLFEKLFLTAAGRLDASSSFGEEDRWQFYPKISGSYLLSEQGFWRDSDFLSTYAPSVKLRAALGYSGGLTAIGPFDRFTTYGATTYSGSVGLLPSSRLGAEGIVPERQREIELGLDMGFLGDRLGFEFTYYNQETEDLLLTRSLAPTTGGLSRLQNVGSLTNNGIELLVRALPLKRDAFEWSTMLTFSANENEVDGLEENVLVLGGFGAVAAINGEPLGVYYGSAFHRNDAGEVVDVNGNVLAEDDDGYWRLAEGAITEQGDGIPQRAFVDENGNGIRDEGEGLAGSQIIGNPNPDWSASWINEFDVGRGFSIRAQLDAVYGQDAFNFTRRLGAIRFFGTVEDFERELEGDLPSGPVDEETGLVNYAAGYNAAVASIFENWVEDASFVKLREVSVAYTFYPQTPRVRSVRLNLAGRNLFSLDDYSGYDPEVNVAGQSTTVRGFDFVEVPIPRTFSFGVTVGL